MSHVFFFKCRESVLTRKHLLSVTPTPHQILVIFLAVTKNKSLDQIKKKLVVFLWMECQEVRAEQSCGWNSKPAQVGGAGSALGSSPGRGISLTPGCGWTSLRQPGPWSWGKFPVFKVIVPCLHSGHTFLLKWEECNIEIKRTQKPKTFLETYCQQ